MVIPALRLIAEQLSKFHQMNKKSVKGIKSGKVSKIHHHILIKLFNVYNSNVELYIFSYYCMLPVLINLSNNHWPGKLDGSV